MACNNLGRNLKNLTESMGPHKVASHLVEAVKAGKVRKSDLSLRDLAESFLGHDWAGQWGRYQANLLEAAEAVDASAFSNITGQLLINEVKERYKSADFIGDMLVDRIPITNGNLQTQKTPWLGAIINAPEQLTQQQPYPMTQFGEQWIEYPAPGKRGFICAITFEMMFSDLTGQAMEAAGAVGDRLGIDEEERKLRTVAGLDNTHIWNGTSYNTYLTVGAWVNAVTGQVLDDYTKVNTVEQLFVNMLDPVSAKAIRVKPSAMLVMPARYYQAKRVVAATETRSGNIAAAPGNQVVAQNPLEVNYPILKSPYLYNLLLASGLTAAQASEYWYLGDFKRAFVYREVFPLQTEQAPPQNPLAFHQDIMVAIRAREYGVAGVRDPRFAARSTNT